VWHSQFTDKVMGWTTKEFNSYQGGDFSVLQNALTGSGAHPISYALATTSCSFPGCKVAGDEFDHSPPSSAEFKNA
jgi:hypothetical protein